MKSIWKNLPLAKKILIPGMLLIVVFSAIIIGYILPVMKQGLIDEKREKLKGIVDISISTLAQIDRYSATGMFGQKDARELARGFVKNQKYGPEGKDYLWINDFHPKMIMHPYVTALDGKDLTANRDREGKALFVEMARVCKEKGAGFVDYMWQYKDQKDKIVPKISYVKAYKPWGLIVGT